MSTHTNNQPFQSASLRTFCPPLSALLVGIVVLGGICLVGFRTGHADEQERPPDSPIRRIYMEKCAGCHGAQGEGTSEYGKPLAGSHTIKELADIIDKTMPKDAAEDCVGEEAQQVAEYIYHEFYSPTAQARRSPVRVELARLTIRQFRYSVADLLGSFRGEIKPGPTGGLRGEYFSTRRMRNEDRVIDRIDPTINFQYGDGSPDGEKIEGQEFTARWQGSVFAPESGEYEFIVKTENGARLWVNRQNRPLIDAWVKSGNDGEFRETIWLLGGRTYPLRLEFLKAKEKSASIGLWWKLPHQADTVVPLHCLSTARVPESYVSSTPFPPDDRSTGFERGTSVSKAWDQAMAEAALNAAHYVVENLRDFTGESRRENNGDERVRGFCIRLAERAFRRPLTEELVEQYVDRHLKNAPDQATGVRRVVMSVLMSPRFQFPDLGATNAPHDIAARLALTLWDSIPDATLLEAAAAGKLSEPAQISAQAERMASDWRATAKLRDFLMQWLKVDLVPDLSKDPKQYPDFAPAVATDLRTSLDLFLQDVLRSPSADFRQLLLNDRIYLNGRLARLYGVELPPDAPFQNLPLEADKRSGVLTHPYLMADFAYTASSSPIHRGLFVTRSLLGRFQRPPPIAVAPLAADLHADLTTRERVSLQTKPEACQACHSLINPLGFTFEHFDAIGRYRHEEHGKPVDSSGYYRSRSGKTVEFTGAPDLAKFLASSDETYGAFSEQLFQYLVKQPIRAYGAQSQTELTRSFVEHQWNIRRLAVEIAARAALRPSPAPSTTGSP